MSPTPRAHSMDASPSPALQKSQQFGHIPGIPVGACFETRKELKEAGVHGEIRAGIHGSQVEGAYSICMSGGYEYDDDRGETITYSGSGGRDDRTGRLLTGQTLDGRGNKALLVSSQTKKPVRLIRGINASSLYPSPYAPESGYRYDGLYVVNSAEKKERKRRCDVWLFELSRYAGQDAGVNTKGEASHSGGNEETANDARGN